MQMVARHGVGVDEEEGCAAPCILHQSGRGIYVERCANDNQRVGLHHGLGSHRYHGHALAKEHDEGPEQRPIARLGAWRYGAVIGVELLLVAWVVWVSARAHLAQFAMQVYHVARARLFVQVINILCNNRYAIFFFQRFY